MDPFHYTFQEMRHEMTPGELVEPFFLHMLINCPEKLRQPYDTVAQLRENLPKDYVPETSYKLSIGGQHRGHN